jgi:hypothetical protein
MLIEAELQSQAVYSQHPGIGHRQDHPRLLPEQMAPILRPLARPHSLELFNGFQRI